MGLLIGLLSDLSYRAKSRARPRPAARGLRHGQGPVLQGQADALHSRALCTEPENEAYPRDHKNEAYPRGFIRKSPQNSSL